MSAKPQITVIEVDAKLLMTPREFAKFTGKSEHEIRDKCKRGVYPHKVKYARDLRPFFRVLVPEALAIIRKECVKNAPPMPRESNAKNKPTALACKVIAKVLGGG